LPVLPPLAIVAAAYGPIPGRPLLSYAGVALALKLALPAMPWGLSFQSGTVQPVAPSLSEYCERARGNELLVLNIDDNLYAAALPLPKLRYGLMEHGPAEGSYAMPFQTMGIIVNTGQFNDLARWEPLYRERLRQWGLDSPEPIASLIQIDSPADLARLVDAHPATDFLLPDRYRSTVDALAQTTHELVPAAPGHFFLLARDLLPRSAPPAWTCRL
jgi:hypothetical protein